MVTKIEKNLLLAGSYQSFIEKKSGCPDNIYRSEGNSLGNQLAARFYIGMIHKEKEISRLP